MKGKLNKNILLNRFCSLTTYMNSIEAKEVFKDIDVLELDKEETVSTLILTIYLDNLSLDSIHRHWRCSFDMKFSELLNLILTRKCRFSFEVPIFENKGLEERVCHLSSKIRPFAYFDALTNRIFFDTSSDPRLLEVDKEEFKKIFRELFRIIGSE